MNNAVESTTKFNEDKFHEKLYNYNWAEYFDLENINEILEPLKNLLTLLRKKNNA